MSKLTKDRNPWPVSVTGSNPVDAAAESVEVTSATAVGLTTVPATATSATISVEDGEIRVWTDGSTPTAASGRLAGDGDEIELTSRAQVLGFLAIAVSTTANLQVEYYA